MNRPEFGPDNIPWVDEPPKGQPTLIKIRSARVETAQLLVSLSDCVCGVYTHYYLDRTIPCLGALGNCVCQTITMLKRWKGYLAAWDTFVERMFLAEITMDAYRLCPMLHKQNGLRGVVFKLYRLGKNKNSPARVDTTGMYDKISLLPPAPDVRDALCRIWMGESHSSDGE